MSSSEQLKGRSQYQRIPLAVALTTAAMRLHPVIIEDWQEKGTSLGVGIVFFHS